MAEEVKELPDGGTRKLASIVIAVIVTALMIIAFYMIASDLIEKTKLEMLLLVFDKWWVAVGVVLGLYIGSENLKKHSYAVLNKN